MIKIADGNTTRRMSPRCVQLPVELEPAPAVVEEESEDEGEDLTQGLDPIQAAKEREQLIPFIKEHLGEEHEDVLCVMGEAAILYQIGGDFPNCLRMMQHQLRIFLEVNGPIHFEHKIGRAHV